MAATSDHPFLRRARAAGCRPEKMSFANLNIDPASWSAALVALQRSSAHMVVGSELRAAVPCDDDLRALCSRAISFSPEAGQAKIFFQDNFTPFKMVDANGGGGFLTGYYEPVVDADDAYSRKFSARLLAWPHHRARRTSDERLPTRSIIEQSMTFATPLVWVRDPIEAFMIQVQGSARLRVRDGRRMRLVYDGRNGLPYTSVGGILIAEGHIDQSNMSLDVLKHWFRNAGQDFGQLGRDTMWRNESFIFFRLEKESASGPIGGQGIALEPLVSLAVDRSIWAYGTPIVISGNLSAGSAEWETFSRVVIAQDTGSAIVGPARGDLYVGAGDEAGSIAGRLRHSVEFIVLPPNTGGAEYED